MPDYKKSTLSKYDKFFTKLTKKHEVYLNRISFSLPTQRSFFHDCLNFKEINKILVYFSSKNTGKKNSEILILFVVMLVEARTLETQSACYYPLPSFNTHSFNKQSHKLLSWCYYSRVFLCK